LRGKTGNEEFDGHEFTASEVETSSLSSRVAEKGVGWSV
jgi:hypothetical protein